MEVASGYIPQHAINVLQVHYTMR